MNATGSWRIPRLFLRRTLRDILREEGVEEGVLSLTFVGDEEIRALHRDHLGKEGPTDVLAFPLHQPGTAFLGDVYVGYEQAARQAAELGIPLEEELLRLAIHGVLHLVGYDHPEGENRLQSPMFRRQEDLLRRALSRP